MAGFFGFFDFTKPGPGVRPDEPRKGPFKRFFIVFLRKFWQLIRVNLMALLFHLPLFVLCFFAFSYLGGLLLPGYSFQHLVEMLERAGMSSAVSQEYATFHHMGFSLMYAGLLCGGGLAVLGPFQAGLSYVLRSFAQEKPCFIWADCVEQARRNWRQALAVSALNLLLSFALPVAAAFYARLVPVGLLRSVVGAVFMLLMLLFYMIQIFIYPLLIGFELRLGQLYRNAVLLVLLRLPQTLGVALLSFFLLLGVPLLISMHSLQHFLALILFYYLFFALAFAGYLSNFFAEQIIERYLRQGRQQAAPQGGERL